MVAASNRRRGSRWNGRWPAIRWRECRRSGSGVSAGVQPEGQALRPQVELVDGERAELVVRRRIVVSRRRARLASRSPDRCGHRRFVKPAGRLLRPTRFADACRRSPPARRRKEASGAVGPTRPRLARRQRRHRLEPHHRLPHGDALIREEEEGAVAPHRAAELAGESCRRSGKRP